MTKDWQKSSTQFVTLLLQNYNTNIKKGLQQNKELVIIESRLLPPSGGNTNRRIIKIAGILHKMGGV